MRRKLMAQFTNETTFNETFLETGGLAINKKHKTLRIPLTAEQEKMLEIPGGMSDVKVWLEDEPDTKDID